jgi:YfiH family protein
MIQKGDFFSFEIFDQEKGLVQAISTRSLGNMASVNQQKREKNCQQFLKRLNLKKENLVIMEQVHGNQIRLVNEKHQDQKILGVDGLVTKSKDVILGVKTADCASLIFNEPGKILAVAHAGWRGTLKKIAFRTVCFMKALGGNPKKILVGIGPFICSSCLEVDQKIASQFKAVFGSLPGMIIKNSKKTFLNLKIPLLNQLKKAGLIRRQIEIANICPACKVDRFFSYRAEGDLAGRALTIASLKERK